jgi:hypothetical protein
MYLSIMDQNILHIVDGNPGAMEVIIKLVQQYPDKVESILSLLQVHHIRGSQIWMMYKSCNKNIDQFVAYPFASYESNKQS